MSRMILDEISSLKFCRLIFQSLEEGSPGFSEIVQDYKKVNRKDSKEGKQKVRRHTTNKRPRELLFMRSIPGEEAKTEDKVGICNTSIFTLIFQSYF